ncbi:solute carrier family 12 member 2-like [Clytia hemisphaerica]|uniref:Uncharacterized protein n=1 Tax=Clytia hemisphaerica TaxID=252671 RepID=A0A7M5X7Q8_9CNID
MGDHIPNNDSDMVELKTIGSTPSSPQSPSSNGNLLHPKAANSPPPLKTTGAGKHARFNIEKVDSPTTTEANTAHNQNTIHDMDTIGYATHEAVPLTMFYRNEASVPGHAKTRPTLEELHKGFDELDEIEAEDGSPPKEKERLIEEGSKVIPRGGSLKFGWFKGVLVPCLLNIWGVILYLRLPLLTGQSGILLITAIILLSACVTTITTLSMSAICTNGEVKGGGAYYLISRALGPEFGGSIGIIFSLANAVGVALYVVGFGETVQQLMQNNGLTMVDKYNDVRIIGVIVVCVLLGVTLIGLDWVIKTQLGLLLILILSMINYVVGCFSGSVLTDLDEQKLQGFTSFSTQTFKDNLFPEFRSGVEGGSFFASFSIFFPAATGILAGVNISGDLKDPGYAIPKGTFTAIVLTTAVYIALAWMIGASTMKDAAGALAPVLAAANGTQNSNNQTVTAVGNTTDSRGLDWCVPNCDYGLLNDVQAMERFSLVGHLVLAGIFAATLSSALASLVGSPKTFQAVCRDGIFKGLGFFGKGSGPNDEPRRAYVLTFLISTGFILIGELNVIAPIISNFFLMSYALINYSVFAASLGRSPGWRPSFKYYNMWLSLLGCFLCIGIMFLINWWAALVTIVIIMTLYKYVDYKKPEINWGSSGQAHTYIKALKLAHSLNRTDEHVKNFRPQCLVLTGAPSSRPNLTLLVSHLTRHVGLMICGQVIVKADGIADTSTVNQEKFLRQKKLKGFVSVTAAPSLRLGAQALMQCSGLGKLRPNIVVIGYKNDWQTDDMEKVNGYINILHDAFEGKLSVALLRTPQKAKGGFLDEEYDDDEYDEELEMNMNSFRNEAAMNPPIVLDYDNENDDEGDRSALESQAPTPNIKRSSTRKKKDSGTPNMNGDREQRSDTILTMDENVTGHIDVWWLYDDGGLTILLPYLLSRNKKYKGCSLRVLTPTSDKKLKSNQVRMASLLKKFRITFSGIVEVVGINSKPASQSIEKFRQTRIKDELSENEPLDKKTLRQIRLGELVREHSRNSKLVVLTMPIPRKSVVSNLMYMSWLETISEDLDAEMLFVRGNQTSVLTFYS